MPSHFFLSPFKRQGPLLLLDAVRQVLLLLGVFLALGAQGASDIPVEQMVTSDFQSVREAVVEIIESDGLVVSAVIPFGRMLERTASSLGRAASPFAQLEIIQFCSAQLAWQLLEEDATQVALCPLSITVFATVNAPEQVVLAYRSPGATTPGRRKADELLRQIVHRAVLLSQPSPRMPH